MSEIKEGWNLIEYTTLPQAANDIRYVKNRKVLTRNTDGIPVETCLRWGWKFTHVEVYEDELFEQLSSQLCKLEETLKFAAQYKDIEARSCPLCRYEDGKFIEHCQMHKDMEIQRQKIDRLTTERDEAITRNSQLVLEGQQKDREISYLRMVIGTPEKWKERYERIRLIHVEDVRKRLEVRRFRAVNFSLEELTEALERKRLGKEPPIKENWGAMLVSALRLANDMYDAFWKIKKYIPEEELKKNYIFYPGRGGFGSRITKLNNRIQDARKRALQSYEKPRF